MENLSNCNLVDELISLDGKHFTDCTLSSCTLSYDGGPVIFERTRILGCNYSFGGAARRTADLLRLIGMLGFPVWNESHVEEPLQ